MIAIGNTKITKAYLGQTELANIAIGDELLLSSEPVIDVEIIDSIMSSSNYVDTGIIANDANFTFVGEFIKGTRFANASWTSFFGNDQGTNIPKYKIMRRSTTDTLSVAAWGVTNYAVNYSGTDVDFILSERKIIIGGTTYSFTKSDNSNPNTTTIKIYFSTSYITTWKHLQTTHNGKIIQDLYPCVDKDSLCGFVDIKTGAVYYPNTPIDISTQTQL